MIGLMAVIAFICFYFLFFVVYRDEVNKRVSFVYKYVTHVGKVYNFRPVQPYILVARTNSVSDLAHRKVNQFLFHVVLYKIDVHILR